MQARAGRGSEQGCRVAPRGIRCPATSVVGGSVNRNGPLGLAVTKKAAATAAFPLPAPEAMLLPLLATLPVREFLANASRFSRTIAQVIKLRPPHVAFAFHFDTRNKWRIGLKCPLDAF